MEPVISVGRDGVEMGDFYLSGVQQGLASGYFLPTDYGWHEGMDAWLPLPDALKTLEPPATENKPGQAIDGVVHYTLKTDPSSPPVAAARPGAKRRKRIDHPAPSDWHDDPATEKQLLYLKSLGATVLDPGMTKGRAHELIQQFINVIDQLSEKQKACLLYHSFDMTKMTLAECWEALDRIHQHPETFNVPEPWEKAKYRLYPQLYGTGAAAPKGCMVAAAVLFMGAAGAFLLHSFH